MDNMTDDTFMPGFTEQQRDDYLDWYQQRQIELIEEKMMWDELFHVEEDDTTTHTSASDTSA